MNKEDRLRVFRSNLLKILSTEKGGFVIFESSDKFVQFEGDQNGVWIDIPREEMTQEEVANLLKLDNFLEQTIRRELKNNDSYEGKDYRRKFNLNEIEQAVLLSEKIFLEIFISGPDYNFQANLNLNEVPGSENFDLNNLDGHQFEDLIEELVNKMGFTVEERKLNADGGIDLLAHSHEPLFEGKYIIQCKRYAQKVSEPPVRDLYGVVHSRNANKGILITNSSFTQAALDFARDKQLELIDGTKLGSMLAKYGLSKSKGGVNLDDKGAYLIYNFLPKIRKVRQSYEDIRNGSIYLEKTETNEKEWTDLLKRTMHISLGFFEWWGKTWAQNFGSFLNEKPLDIQKLNATSDQLIQALRKFFKIYKTFLETTSPTKFNITREKCLRYLEHLFGMVFQINNDLELLSKLPKEELRERISETGRINMKINAKFPYHLSHAVIAAYNEAE